jgi:ParB-like nuclease domain
MSFRDKEKGGAATRPLNDYNQQHGNGATSRAQGANPLQPELDLIQLRRLDSIRPAPENDAIYNAIALNDPAILELARSIKERGMQDPLLISSDGFIISGHRRRLAAAIAGLDHAPVRVHQVSRTENREEFLKLLVECNSQRIKSASELLHETIIKIDPIEAHKQIVAEREEKMRRSKEGDLTIIDPGSIGRRCVMSAAKQPLLSAILAICTALREWWPLSVRQIHYKLLNNPPLIHASKLDSRYANNMPSYRACIDVCTRGRTEGFIPWAAIDDRTRPVFLNAGFKGVPAFLQQELEGFLTGYWRNLMQSQSDHFEILAEKLTVQTVLQQVAEDHTIPLTIMRGMSAMVRKRNIVDRYRLSRKRKLVLLVVTDLDPMGDTSIAEDLVKSFKRDFGLFAVEAYKVALTIEQVRAYQLAPSMDAKTESPGYAAYVEKYNTTDAWELEAMDPGDLAQELTEAIGLANTRASLGASSRITNLLL